MVPSLRAFAIFLGLILDAQICASNEACDAVMLHRRRAWSWRSRYVPDPSCQRGIARSTAGSKSDPSSKRAVAITGAYRIEAMPPDKGAPC